MTAAPATFDDLLAPMAPGAFLADYYGQRPVHIAGSPDKFAGVLTWDGLSGLLNQSSLWTHRSLELVLDNRKVDVSEYCRPGKDRDFRDNLLVDFERVGRFLRQGASLVLNVVDDLAPGIRAIAQVLGDQFGAKVQGNLYCSWQAHQGFGSHFDTHDVYAVHLAGEKTWRIYGKQFDDPVAHPSFKTFGQEFHDQHKGELTQEVTLKPGDLLYIPRGWYHDALATSEATFHIAFGVTTMIGLDLLSILFDRAVQDPAFRASVPRAPEHLAEHFRHLGNRLAGYVAEPEFRARVLHAHSTFPYSRPILSLPQDALVRRFRRRAREVALFQRNGAWWLGTDKKAVPVPPGLEGPVRWMLERDGFDATAFHEQHRAIDEPRRAKLLTDLQAMKVIEPA